MFLVVIIFFKEQLYHIFTKNSYIYFNIDEQIILYIHLGGGQSKLHIFFIVYLKLMFHPEFDSPISCKGKKQ